MHFTGENCFKKDYNKLVICIRGVYRPSTCVLFPVEHVSDSMKRRVLREFIPSRNIHRTGQVCNSDRLKFTKMNAAEVSQWDSMHNNLVDTLSFYCN